MILFESYLELLLVGIILLLPFLYDFCKAFKYYLKFVFYYFTLGSVCGSLIPYYLLRPRNVYNLLFTSKILKHISTIIGIKWILKGKEYLEKEEPYIIVCNHQSALDILGMFDVWEVMKKCTALAKFELIYAFPFGPAAWLAGLKFITNTGKNQKTLDAINTVAQEIKKDKIKVWVYPEGRRFYDGKIHEFKKGAFHMAINAQLPILPIVFSHYYFKDKSEKRFDQGTVIATCLPPISTEGLTSKDVDSLLNNVKADMENVFVSSSKEAMEAANYRFSNNYNSEK